MGKVVLKTLTNTSLSSQFKYSTLLPPEVKWTWTTFAFHATSMHLLQLFCISLIIAIMQQRTKQTLRIAPKTPIYLTHEKLHQLCFAADDNGKRNAPNHIARNIKRGVLLWKISVYSRKTLNLITSRSFLLYKQKSCNTKWAKTHKTFYCTYL